MPAFSTLLRQIAMGWKVRFTFSFWIAQAVTWCLAVLPAGLARG